MAKILLVATHNSHKTEEFRSILGDLFEEIVDLTGFPDLDPPEEDGATFAENSEIKALAASRANPEAFVIADDSGLEVDALDGAPGVQSSRYSGENATDGSNRVKLMTELAKPEHLGKPKTARFRCVITVAKDGETVKQFDGTVEGMIASVLAGDRGFGYDPLFVPEGYEASFGQLSEDIKNEMSHRGRALEKFRKWWVTEAQVDLEK